VDSIPTVAIEANMHRAASRFASAAKGTDLKGGLNEAFSEIIQQCTSSYLEYKAHYIFPK
jgi:hypothetical protein